MWDWLSDWQPVIAVIVSTLALIVSIIAILNSLRSSNTAKQALRISRAQEERRLRNLAGSLIDALFDVDSKSTHYVISVTIRNPADNSNAVSAFELWVHYHAGENRLVAKIAPRPDFADQFTVITGDHALIAPLKIEPGNTVRGWIGFTVPRGLVQPTSIDGYRLAVMDTHEAETFVDFAQVRKTVFEMRDKNEAE